MNSNKTESIFLWLFFTIFILLCLTPFALFLAREITSSPEAMAVKYNEWLLTNPTDFKWSSFQKWFAKNGGFLYDNWSYWILFFTSIIGAILIIVAVMQVWKMKANDISMVRRMRLENKLREESMVKNIFLKKDDGEQDGEQQ